MYRPPTLQMNPEQKVIHRAWLEETLAEHRSRMSRDKDMRADELVREKNRLKIEAEEEISYNRYVKEAKQRQKEIMNQVNQTIIEKHEVVKDRYLREKQDPWGDNFFFKKLWAEKGVIILDKEAVPADWRKVQR